MNLKPNISLKVILFLVIGAVLIAGIVIFLSGSNNKTALEKEIIKGATGKFEKGAAKVDSAKLERDTIIVLLKELKQMELRKQATLYTLEKEIQKLNKEYEAIDSQSAPTTDGERAKFFADRYTADQLHR